MRGQGARSAGQVEGHDRRQQLRRETDRERDGEKQRVVERPVTDHVHRKHPDHQDDRHAADQEAEGADAVLEVGLGRPLGEPVGDRPIAGPGAGGGDLGQPCAAHDARSEEG